MASRERPLDRARRLLRRTARMVGEELRNARLGAGLSQREAASRCELSHSQVGRIERAERATLDLGHVFRIATVVGLEPVVRLYPGIDPVRDAGQLRLLERFRSRLHPSLRWRTEVPVMQGQDGRAWDAVVSGTGFTAGIEAETRLHDLQALERALNLKVRDGDLDLVILLVAETRQNRLALAAAGASLRATFPVPQREVMRALAAGRRPRGGGLVVL